MRVKDGATKEGKRETRKGRSSGGVVTYLARKGCCASYALYREEEEEKGEGCKEIQRGEMIGGLPCCIVWLL